METPSERRRLAVRTGDVNRLSDILQPLVCPLTSSNDYVEVLYQIERDCPTEYRGILRDYIFGILQENSPPPQSQEDWPSNTRARSETYRELENFRYQQSSSSVSSSVSGVFDIAHKAPYVQDASFPIADLVWQHFREHLIQDEGLHLCARYGRYKFLKETLREMRCKGLNELRHVIYAKNTQNRTLLEVAVWHGQISCIQLLGCLKLEPHPFEDKEARGSPKIPLLILALQSADNFECLRNDLKPRGSMAITASKLLPQLTRNDWENILRLIIQLHPASLYERTTDLYPPLHEARQVAKRHNWPAIEDIVRQGVFHHIKDCVHASQALFSPDDTIKEFTLDLSDFNQDTTDFPKFVAELEEHDKFVKNKIMRSRKTKGANNAEISQVVRNSKIRKNDALMQQMMDAETNSVLAQDEVNKNDHEHMALHFEDTLLYLILPYLERISVGGRHDPISRFLEWLHKRPVRAITHLVIPDDPHLPLNEEFFEIHFLQHFEIRTLDWHRLDMSLDLLTESSTMQRSLQSLCLYSSGNWSVLYHWAGPDGLPKLSNVSPAKYLAKRAWIDDYNQLREVTISIVDPKITGGEEAEKKRKKRVEKMTRELRYMLRQAKFKLHIVTGHKFSTLTRPTEADVLDSSLALGVFHDLENCRKFLDFLKYKVEQHPELRAWSAKLWNSPVKIAVIDNGTDKFRHPTSQNIQKGITFMDSGILDGRVLPWYTAADAHGTQMAYLIRRVNPQCHLFVARVGTFRRDIKPEAAVNAIQWAVSQKVDIISISWITRRRSKPLYNAIREAAKTTLIFGTTADEGTNAMHEKIWPKRVIRVSASDSMGHPRPQSEASDDKVDFLLQGEAIMAYGPKYMDKVAESRISGSSVATALAAGVGSLLLTLARLYDLDDNRHSDRFKKKKHMITLFENLYNNDTDRVVVLGKLLKRKFDYDKLKQELPFILKEFRYQGREDDEDDDTDSEDGH